MTNRDIYDELKDHASEYFESDNIFELESMKNRVIDYSEYFHWETSVGKYSYGPICRRHRLIESIGSFSSFAAGVDAVENHEIRYITTHVMMNMGNSTVGCDRPREVVENAKWYFPGVCYKDDLVKKQKRCVIGNDVWLGRNVIIANGASIGNGVIAAAGDVITEDVPDYAVVGGVPARIIRYRYTPEQIEALNKIAWWDWPDDVIRARYDDFYLPIEEFIEKYL